MTSFDKIIEYLKAKQGEGKITAIAIFGQHGNRYEYEVLGKDVESVDCIVDIIQAGLAELAARRGLTMKIDADAMEAIVGDVEIPS